MTDSYTPPSFRLLFSDLIQKEIRPFRDSLFKEPVSRYKRQYLTVKEVMEKTNLGVSVIRDLRYARAMPHLLVKSRVLFIEEEIMPTIDEYKLHNWNDPDGKWDVKKAQQDIGEHPVMIRTKEENTLIEEAFRQIVREELEELATELKRYTKQENSYSRTNLTVKEAAKYFRTSNATIMSLIHEEQMPHIRLGSRYIIQLEEAESFLWRKTVENYAYEGNVYWKRILNRLDEEETKRKLAYQRALERLEQM